MRRGSDAQMLGKYKKVEDRGRKAENSKGSKYSEESGQREKEKYEVRMTKYNLLKRVKHPRY